MSMLDVASTVGAEDCGGSNDKLFYGLSEWTNMDTIIRRTNLQIGGS